jgi:type I restriction enzyme S subunit
VEGLQLTLPAVTEQKRIVAILDGAFAGIDTAIANTQKNPVNARELFNSYLNSVFSQQGEGWTVETLDHICVIARGGSPRPIKAYLTDESGGVNWIKISDATASSKFVYETKQKIRPEGVKKSRMVHAGDLLLSNSMSFGRPYIMRTSGCIHDGWLVLSNKVDAYETNYLYYFLGSPEAYSQFDLRASGSTVRNLNIDLVRSVKVPIPPLPEQARIAANIEELEIEAQRLEAIYQQKLTALAELKQSLLQKAFAGELTADAADAVDAVEAELA